MAVSTVPEPASLLLLGAGLAVGGDWGLEKKIKEDLILLLLQDEKRQPGPALSQGGWLYAFRGCGASPAYAGSHGCEAVEGYAAGVLQSLGEGGHAWRVPPRHNRDHGCEAVGLHEAVARGVLLLRC
ncbi:MAG: PEP-CTERM sorting domain-containing protein [Nitrospira sp.]|nr:MAG: PEP-CTERM sorting domain-containing protein [Nitrospira sp.]